MKLLYIFIFLITFTESLPSDPFILEYELQNSQLAPYIPPSRRQIAYESSDKIKNALNQKGKGAHLPFWNKMIDQEERGFFGYHAAKQKFRVYQDIIKIIFEEILEMEIKKDFHFFRIPLEPDLIEFDSASGFLSRFPYIDDAYTPQRDQILSMNYTIYGNFNNDSQCSVCYFSNNQSWFTINYEKKLEFLFNQLGMPKSDIYSLFNTGSTLSNTSTGVLYQFFDTSHHIPYYQTAYELVDQIAYPALGAGKYDTDVSGGLSDLFQGRHKMKFDVNTGQIRLIMNSQQTLNPYSNLTIKRYELTSPKIVSEYENSLRQKIRKLSANKESIKKYKKQLEELWHVKTS